MTVFVDTNVLVYARDRTETDKQRRAAEDARDDVTALGAWSPVAIDHRTIEGARDVQDRYGYSWWDSLIVAAALQSGCRYLLTEDLQSADLQTDQVIETLTIISPFAQEPGEILPGP